MSTPSWSSFALSDLASTSSWDLCSIFPASLCNTFLKRGNIIFFFWAFQTAVTWSGFSWISMHSISSRSFLLARFFFLWCFLEGGKKVRKTGKITKQCRSVQLPASSKHLNSVKVKFEGTKRRGTNPIRKEEMFCKMAVPCSWREFFIHWVRVCSVASTNV